MSLPLEDYAMIGDGETAALVSRHGSIDWLCLPRFDSPACCASLLGTPDHGHWSIVPEQAIRSAQQRYEPDTMVLQTEMRTDSGTVQLTDFMPIRDGKPLLVRIVSGVSGRVAMSAQAVLRFDHGNMPPWVERCGESILCSVGPDEVLLHGFGKADISDGRVACRFDIAQGERRAFMLMHRFFDRDAPPGSTFVAPDAAAPTQCPAPAAAGEQRDPFALLESTRRYWREWMGCLAAPACFEDALRRSVLVLKALVHRPTGGLVAAATTSLPERLGGSRNWDYRFCWLRDASFTVAALLGSGFREEAGAWRDWVLRAVAGAPEKMHIVYRVDGSRRLDESELPWLPGYRFARPVRVGNAASEQFQLDVYGELMNTLYLCEAAGMRSGKQMRHLQQAIAEHVSRAWVEPDQGLWEVRGEPRHYTYSKVMAWVAVDRFLRSPASQELDADARRSFEDLRTEMHAVICKEGFNTGMDSFTEYFGGQHLDASLLLLPKLGFLPVDDPRMHATITAIETQLVVDGLVYRNLSEGFMPEGAFLACTLWLAECQILQGRRAAARDSIERVWQRASPTGLLSEEYDLRGRCLSGNYPQALSHIALVNALLALDRSRT